jgi:Xaa-Pro dipeptidase
MEPIGFNKRRVSEIMQKMGVDILVATSPENVFYSSGLPVKYDESNPVLFVLASQHPSIVVINKSGEEALITWHLFTSADKASWVKNISGIISRDQALQRLESIVEEAGLPEGGTIGIESEMPYYQSNLLRKVFPDTRIRISDDIFMEMRLHKSEEEIKRIRESTRISEKAIKAMIESIKEGVTDIELVKVAKIQMIKEGATGFNNIGVALDGSDPQYPVTGAKMKKGGLAMFDIGAVYGGYCSDVSRHASLGSPPPGAEVAVDLMIEVQKACADVIKPGIEPSRAVKTAEDIYKRRGAEEFFFVTIHSVGLTGDEYTFYDAMVGPSPMRFEEGMVISIEALTFFHPQGLVGIEDSYLITRSGSKKISTLEGKIYRK